MNVLLSELYESKANGSPFDDFAIRLLKCIELVTVNQNITVGEIRDFVSSHENLVRFYQSIEGNNNKYIEPFTGYDSDHYMMLASPLLSFLKCIIDAQTELDTFLPSAVAKRKALNTTE